MPFLCIALNSLYTVLCQFEFLVEEFFPSIKYTCSRISLEESGWKFDALYAIEVLEWV